MFCHLCWGENWKRGLLGYLGYLGYLRKKSRCQEIPEIGAGNGRADRNTQLHTRLCLAQQWAEPDHTA